jgi:hypothetical protein
MTKYNVYKTPSKPSKYSLGLANMLNATIAME